MGYLHSSTIFFYSLSTLFYFAYLFLAKDKLQRFGFYSLLVAFLLNFIKLALIFKAKGFLICYGLSEVSLIVSFAIAGIVIFLRYKFKLKIIGVSAVPIAAMASILAIKGTPHLAIQASFAKNIWVLSHILLIFAGDAFFAIAFGMSIIFLMQNRSIKYKKSFFFKLPSLNSIETTIDFCIKAGFLFLSFGLIIGIIYAKIAWGKFWSWDVKELGALVTWLMYAFILHSRAVFSSLSGKKTAIMTIIAFCVLIFTFLGLNFLMQGHHSNFTL